MNNKSITVITINLNNKDGLTKTIESVIGQTFFHMIQFVIIDGGSTDGSLDVIEKYQDYIDFYVSEKDTGIYNAMNKGVKYAKGEYCIFLNSGDFFYARDVIEKASETLNCDIVYGNEAKEKKSDCGAFKWHSEQNTKRYYTNGRWHEPHEEVWIAPNKVDEEWFKNNALPHQSTFIKTELLREHPYNEDYKTISDWLFMKDRIADGASYKHIPITISVFHLDGISSHGGWYNEKERYYTHTYARKRKNSKKKRNKAL